MQVILIHPHLIKGNHICMDCMCGFLIYIQHGKLVFSRIHFMLLASILENLPLIKLKIRI